MSRHDAPRSDRARRAAWAVSWLASMVVLGCGSTAPAAPAAPSAEGTARADVPSPESTETPGPELMTPEVRGTAPSCAVVSLGFDHRALPTSTSPAGFDSWVAGEADDLRRAAPAGTPPRMYVVPGGGTVHALFDGATADEVLARCEQTVAAYLPTAPSLPLIGSGPAAHVLLSCRSCD